MAKIGVLSPEEAGRKAKAAVAEWEATGRRNRLAGNGSKPAPEPPAAAKAGESKPMDPEKARLAWGLHYLAKKGDLEALRKLIDSVGGKVLPMDPSTMAGAIRGKQPEVVAFLIGMGADVEELINLGKIGRKDAEMENAERAGWVSRPLVMACEGGNENIVQVLLNAGADVNGTDGNGYTPLMVACLKGHSGVVKILLEREADANAQSNKGETAVQLAEKANHKNIVVMLRKHEQKKAAGSNIV